MENAISLEHLRSNNGGSVRTRRSARESPQRIREGSTQGRPLSSIGIFRGARFARTSEDSRFRANSNESSARSRCDTISSVRADTEGQPLPPPPSGARSTNAHGYGSTLEALEETRRGRSITTPITFTDSGENKCEGRRKVLRERVISPRSEACARVLDWLYLNL